MSLTHSFQAEKTNVNTHTRPAVYLSAVRNMRSIPTMCNEPCRPYSVRTSRLMCACVSAILSKALPYMPVLIWLSKVTHTYTRAQKRNLLFFSHDKLSLNVLRHPHILFLTPLPTLCFLPSAPPCSAFSSLTIH